MIPLRRLSTQALDGADAPSLGVLSVHLDGAACKVGCEFCYLGQRSDESAAPDLALVEEALARLKYDEVAVAVSEPVEAARGPVERLARAAAARKIPLAITTTTQIAQAAPEILDGAARVNLSVDPRKGAVDPARLAQLAERLHARRPSLDVVLIVSLISPEFAARLIDEGLLAELVALVPVDKVALNGLKPPPPWCDRAFWMRSLAKLRPLLDRQLDRKLFLDCYVAARLLELGGCPARADLSPSPRGLAFRSCVYQPSLEMVAATVDELVAHTRHFTPPARCPFPIV